MTLKRMTDQPSTGKKYLQQIYLTKDVYLEYIKITLTIQ